MWLGAGVALRNEGRRGRARASRTSISRRFGSGRPWSSPTARCSSTAFARRFKVAKCDLKARATRQVSALRLHGTRGADGGQRPEHPQSNAGKCLCNDDLQAKVDSLKALQAKTAAELDALLPSILDKAFKGEL
jgi:hypothetical protein